VFERADAPVASIHSFGTPIVSLYAVTGMAPSTADWKIDRSTTDDDRADYRDDEPGRRVRHLTAPPARARVSAVLMRDVPVATAVALCSEGSTVTAADVVALLEEEGIDGVHSVEFMAKESPNSVLFYASNALGRAVADGDVVIKVKLQGARIEAYAEVEIARSGRRSRLR
jgi:hypothetical protein